jgi:hypothetical protein
MLAATADAQQPRPPAPEAPARMPVLPIEGGALRDEVSLGFAFHHAADDTPQQQGTSALVLSGRVSYLETIELALSLPILATRTVPDLGGGMDGRAEDGFGNLGFTFKLRLLGLASRVRLAAYVAVRLPTFVGYGDDRYRHDDWLSVSSIRPGVALSWRSGTLSLQVDLAGLFTINDWSGLVALSPGATLPFPSEARWLSSLLIGGHVSLRLRRWLSLLGGMQLRARLSDSHDGLTISDDRAHLVLLAGLRGHASNTFVELLARAAPVTIYEHRERFGLQLAVGYRFSAGS